MIDRPRLIEVAFPLKQASLDSVHEKNVRHGHISTLHIWPARRPLAACRAALIATLLPDPGTPEARRALCERIGGKVIKVVRRKTLPDGRSEDRTVEETLGGILHWGRETTNKADLDYFRDEIRKAYGGRAPRVLDPFAGGGAIPLEAMRLGCEATAIDINPVAWFILKCTLEYPQKLAGQKRRLPDFALRDAAFMESFFTAQGLRKPMVRTFLKNLDLGEDDKAPPLMRVADDSFLDADLAWHVRAWGRWVLDGARRELAAFYPVYADYEPLKKTGQSWERQPMRLVPLHADGVLDVDVLNREFDARPSPFTPHKRWLDDPACPRWVAKPTVAYLWARTVRCKNCRATIPLLKTRWLTKKANRRVLLTMERNADKTAVVFGIERDVPAARGNNAVRREHDRKLSVGTMSRAGAWCPCCGKPGTVAMAMEDIRREGGAGRLGAELTAVAVDSLDGRQFRLPTDAEIKVGVVDPDHVARALCRIPFGAPEEATPRGGSGASRAFSVHAYGMTRWRDLFRPRQLLAISAFIENARRARDSMSTEGYPAEWVEALSGFLAMAIDRLADRSSTLCRPDPTPTQSGVINTFSRFALPITWDFIEGVTIAPFSGGFSGAVEWVAKVAEQARHHDGLRTPTTLRTSAVQTIHGEYDAIVTDPPYYDAIPYSDLMDFFYVWLRRTLRGHSADVDEAFHGDLAPKWDAAHDDGELIDDSSRFGGDRTKSKKVYEDGMFRAFQSAWSALASHGRMVVVFANKQPDAWEALVSAMVRAGFVVDGSWPIQTEMGNRTRALSSAALASSVWLVCKKRPETARPGWDNQVLAEMKSKIDQRLREFWDAGIHGPDFVWAATGPAMEAYSKHPIVKKADTPGELMTVAEFLRSVRRIVVDFVVGRVLSEATHGEADPTTGAGLDDITTYYLLHRYDFKLEDAPAGACILYAVSCNVSESELAGRHDILARTGRVLGETDDEEDADEVDAEDADEEEGTGSTFKLKGWKQRAGVGVGGGPGERPVPLIDQIHRLMHLWRAGDQAKVDQYLDDRRLRRSQIFQHVLQALIELAPEASEERAILETLMNHVRARGVAAPATGAFEFPTQGPGDNDT